MKLKQRLALGLINRKIKFYAAFSKKKAAKEAFKFLCTPLAPEQRDTPLIYRQGKPAKFMIDGYKIRGHKWNHPKDNRVLIIHGFSSASYKFDKYVISLINKGYEVIAFDALAHGKSEGKTVNILQYRDMIKKAIYKFGPINKFIAHSFGGLALCLALEDIEHDENTNVVLLSPATETSTAIDYAFAMINLKDRRIRNEVDNLIFDLSGNSPEWFSIKRAMPNIKANILWIHDEDDHVTPIKDVVKVQEKKFPNIEFMFTNGLGHNNIYHDPKVKDAVTNFL
jgi:pimeloyl-ACP methyl ester carboxylesterase